MSSDHKDLWGRSWEVQAGLLGWRMGGEGDGGVVWRGLRSQGRWPHLPHCTLTSGLPRWGAHALPLLPFVTGAVNPAGSRPAGPVVIVQALREPSAPAARRADHSLWHAQCWTLLAGQLGL